MSEPFHLPSLPGKQRSKMREYGLLIHLNVSCSIRTELWKILPVWELRVFVAFSSLHVLVFAPQYQWDQQLEHLFPSAGDKPTGPKGKCERGTFFLIASWHMAELMEVAGPTAALEESIADSRRSRWPRAAITNPGLSNLKRGVSTSFSFYGQNPEVFIQSLLHTCSRAKASHCDWNWVKAESQAPS